MQKCVITLITETGSINPHFAPESPLSTFNCNFSQIRSISLIFIFFYSKGREKRICIMTTLVYWYSTLRFCQPKVVMAPGGGKSDAFEFKLEFFWPPHLVRPSAISWMYSTIWLWKNHYLLTNVDFLFQNVQWNMSDMLEINAGTRRHAEVKVYGKWCNPCWGAVTRKCKNRSALKSFTLNEPIHQIS